MYERAMYMESPVLGPTSKPITNIVKISRSEKQYILICSMTALCPIQIYFQVSMLLIFLTIIRIVKSLSIIQQRNVIFIVRILVPGTEVCVNVRYYYLCENE